MRVIAGALKGRRLQAPAWEGLRPTSDKLRETLFNVLAPRIGGARVLDGYAGTGAVGIEALSRGAAHVTFVERDPRAAALAAAEPLVETGTLLVLEHAKRDAAPTETGALIRTRLLISGDSALAFYSRASTAPRPRSEEPA